tara:strand:- start:167 stop:328 length:162 start_codon:yes stop_codon:yes gene_type:complete
MSLPAGKIGDDEAASPQYDFGQNTRIFFQNYFCGNDYPLLHELRMIVLGDIVR